jgi:hypothetical protein
MDYVTRQFIFLAKKFRKELRNYVSDLNSALHKQTEAISKSYQAYERKQSPPPEVAVLPRLPESIEVHHNAQDTSDERNYKRFTFFVSTLTLGAIVVYAVLVYWQYREMINSREQMQGAIAAANRSAKAAEDATTNSKAQFRQDQRPYVWLLSGHAYDLPQISQAQGHIGYLQEAFHFSNYGKSPAVNVRQDAHIAVGDKECRELKGQIITSKYGTLMPTNDQSPFNFAYSKDTVTQEVLNSISAGDTPACIFGHFEYTDLTTIPEITYISEFCAMLPINNATFNRPTPPYCVGHNRMGEQ